MGNFDVAGLGRALDDSSNRRHDGFDRRGIVPNPLGQEGSRHDYLRDKPKVDPDLVEK